MNKIFNKNFEIIGLTQQIDSLRSTNIDLVEKMEERQQEHLNFIGALQDEVARLTILMQDLKMDMARNELDSRLRD
tara:strand:+ start:708 stop:935 length:228 start_codon:yes stop_codon:yes gene_type:complete